MIILVLGGNGFIGSHVVDALLADGHKVRVFDRGLGNWEQPIENVSYFYGDFSDSHLLLEGLSGVDVVIHLISATVPSTSNIDPIADVQNNLINTLKLLQLMVSANVMRIIYTSSGGTVYGNPSVLPVGEDHSLNPICSYGVVKVGIEKYLGMFDHIYGLKSLIIRPSNPYGPRQGHNGIQGVIPTFMNKIMTGDRISIWGNGEIKRDYLYVTDLAELFCKAVTSPYTGVVNAGSGIGISLNELTRAIEKTVGNEAKIDYLEGRSFDVKELVLDVNRASSELDWNPVTSIEVGLKKQFEWMTCFSC